MNKENKYLFAIFALLIHVTVAGQYSRTWKSFNENSNRPGGKLMGEVYYLTSLANSNFFMQKDWMDGTVTLTDGDVFTGVKLRYLAYGDEIVAFNENIRTLYIIDKNTVKEFTLKIPISNGLIRERKFVNLDSTNLTGRKSYFEELYSGNAQLLAYHFIEEVKVSPFTDNMGIKRDSEYRLKVAYYILSSQKGFSRILRKKSSFYKIYPEDKKELRRLFRTNKISISDEGSLIQAFRSLDAAGFLK